MKMIDILLGAIIFSIWYVVLFFEKTIGLSMLLFAVPFTYFIIYVLEKRNENMNKKAKILLIPITSLSSTFFIYNNKFFYEMNLLIIPLLLIIMILALYNEKFNLNIYLLGRIIGVFIVPISFIGESFTKVTESLEDKLKIQNDYRKSKKIKRIVKAILITTPIVLVIIALLSSADENFGNIFIHILTNILNFITQIQISQFIIRIILIGIIFVYLIGFFYYITHKMENDTENIPSKIKTDIFTIKMILIALNVVYLLFSIIQIKSLFEIRALSEYSAYARQGFFQLMVVSVINLITILIAKKSEENEQQTNRYINVMSIIMILFTFIIIISSAVRMYYYEKAFGYTLLRLLVYCSLFAETVLLIPTAMYILDKKINLPKTYFIIIISIYICMNFANFDFIIMKRNVDRYIKTGKIDMDYIEYDIGTDGISQLLRVIELNKNDECTVQAKEFLNQVYTELQSEKMDFRDLNISKIVAKKMIEK